MKKPKMKASISIATVIMGIILGTTYFVSNKTKVEELYSSPTTEVKKDINDDKNKDIDIKNQEEIKKQEEAKQIEEQKRQEEQKKQEELKQAEQKKQEELKKAEAEKQAEIKKQQEAKKQEEIKKQENSNEPVKNVQPVAGSNIIQSAKSYAVPVREVNGMLNGKKNGQKEIFLTFDDGPSYNTPKVLSILKKYGVHGTFFTLGSNIDSSNTNKQYLKDIYNSGNTIGNHTYSHNFSTLYPGNRVSVNAFMNELDRTNNIIRSVLGNSFSTSVMRMPGGYMSRQYYKDGNLGSLNQALGKANIVSLDWNVDSGDASGVNVPASKIVSNTIKQAGNSEDIVLLMHDAAGKGTTVEALPQIIEHFKNQGYSFKVISN